MCGEVEDSFSDNHPEGDDPKRKGPTNATDEGSPQHQGEALHVELRGFADEQEEAPSDEEEHQDQAARHHMYPEDGALNQHLGEHREEENDCQVEHRHEEGDMEALGKLFVVDDAYEEAVVEKDQPHGQHCFPHKGTSRAPLPICGAVTLLLLAGQVPLSKIAMKELV
ncbi:hypothetical protein TREES_T100017156 [Tupaia chinensis]|uniref:Uncharacterized protein n=1 Tax=Tupaia chinensis TaxID=246437 RepID=L9KHG1_TUPCH|nr:hypothetical protein TREES_T100017156 [Tupaia chinensis]